MKITIYGKLDPRRLTSPVKSVADLRTLMETLGEPIEVYNPYGELTFDTPVYPKRNVTLIGKYAGVIMLTGNIQFILKGATLSVPTTTDTTQPHPVIIMDNFVGDLIAIDSVIGSKATFGVPAISHTETPNKLRMECQRMYLENTTVYGSYISCEHLELASKVVLTGVVHENVTQTNVSDTTSHILARSVSTHNAVLTTTSYYLGFYDQNFNFPKIAQLEICGPTVLDGLFDIQTIWLKVDRQYKKLPHILTIQVPRDTNEFPTVVLLHGVQTVKHSNISSLTFVSNATLRLVDMNNPIDCGSIVLQNAQLEYQNSRDVLKVVNLNDSSTILIDKNSSSILPVQKCNALPPLPTSVGEQDVPIEPAPEEITATADSDSNSAVDSDSKFDDKLIDDEPKKSTDSDHKDGMTRLNELIGLGAVKTQIRKMVSVARMNKERKERNLGTSEDFYYNMVFAGSPGTGKTTVANIIAQILYEEGVTKRNKLVEAATSSDSGGDPSDGKVVMPLIGTVVGKTAELTQAAIDAAAGGVLFIDEAYYLNKPEDPYVPDAINAILRNMGSPKCDVVFILAGYTKEMKAFLEESNAGMKSRVPNWIEFPDYSISELKQIAQYKFKVNHARIPDGFMSLPKFESLIGFYTRDHGNARSIKNLVQALLEARDMRCMSSNKPLEELTDEELTMVTVVDLDRVYNKAIETYKKERAHQEYLLKQAQLNEESEDDPDGIG